MSGQLVDRLEFNGTNPFDGTLFWDMFSKDGIEVASGLYIIEANRDVVPGFLTGTYMGFVDPNSDPTYNYNDTAISISWAYQFTDRLSMGLTGKYINQSIDGESAGAYAIDAGAIYEIGYKGARIGARMNNLGSDLKYYVIGTPRTHR